MKSILDITFRKGVTMRKYYIDNLRTLVILLLFPFHTFRMYTSFDPFYVQGMPNIFCDISVSFISIWFLFLQE